MKILTFFKILSIILETYHYYVYLSYRKRRDGEESFKSTSNRLTFSIDLPSRKFDYTRNLSLSLLLYVYLSYRRREGVLDQLQIIDLWKFLFSLNIIHYIRIITTTFIYLTKEGKKELYINSKSTYIHLDLPSQKLDENSYFLQNIVHYIRII